MGPDESKLRNLDDQTWLIDLGHAIIEKKRASGIESLSPRERLILAFWVADYGMRNAGDLSAARALDPNYLADAREAAARLQLPHASAAFAMTEGELEQCYFDLFERLCAELRGR